MMWNNSPDDMPTHMAFSKSYSNRDGRSSQVGQTGWRTVSPRNQDSWITRRSWGAQRSSRIDYILASPASRAATSIATTPRWRSARTTALFDREAANPIFEVARETAASAAVRRGVEDASES